MSKISNIFHHYSNEYLFKKRENDFKLNQNALTNNNPNQTYQHIYFKPKKPKGKYKSKNVDFSLLSHSTTNLLKEMSTEKNIRQNLWNKIFSVNQETEKNEKRCIIKEKNLSKNRSFNDSNIIFEKIDKNVTNFYKKINNLKEISGGNKMNRSLFNIKRHTYKNNNGIRKEKEPLKFLRKSKSFVNNIPKYDNNIGVLKYFEGKITSNKNKENLFMTTCKSNSVILKESDRDKYYTNLIDLKTKQFKIKNESIYDYMGKIMKYKLLNNENKVNENLNVNYIENSKNNLNYCNDLYINLTNSKTLLSKSFSGAVESYLRFIYMKIDEEKKLEYFLVKKIIYLREEVNQLNSVLKKKESERNKVLKWIYFQIKVKEKILLIPPHYKEIIENIIGKDYSKKENRAMKLTRMSIKVSSSKRSKNLSLVGLSSRKSFKVKRPLNQSSKDVTNYKRIKRSTDKGNIIPDEEIEKIKNYLKHPIFSNVEDLVDNLEIFKNKILLKIKKYEALKEQNTKDKNYLIKNQKHSSKYQINYEKLINEKKIEVDNLKILANSKIIEKNKLQNLSDDKSLFSIFKDTNVKVKFENYPLFMKINSLYEKCSEIPMDMDYNNFQKIKNSDSHPILIEMLFKIKYVTMIANKILIEFKFYKENDEHKRALIKKLKNQIDKESKMAKNLEQKRKEKQKFFKFLNKVKEKNEKILFIPYRKVDKSTKISQKKKIMKNEDSISSFFNLDI